jgi:solute:Na+ symporter, SSS family
VGLPGGIYAEGAGYGIWFLGYILLAYPVGYFVGPLMWRAGKRYGAMTVPDVFKGHYGSRMLEVVAALSAIVFLVPWGSCSSQVCRSPCGLWVLVSRRLRPWWSRLW